MKYIFEIALAAASMVTRIRTVVLGVVDAPHTAEVDLAATSTSQIPADNDSEAPNPVADVLTDLYPRLDPVKAKQTFDSPDGFGEWGIYMAGEAIKHLREFRRKDQHTFEIVQKKIKELSTGFFSPDNQKHLVGGDKSVNIYEAKMTGDLRLIYRVDLQSDSQLRVR